MKKQILGIAALSAAATLGLAACGGSSSTSAGSSGTTTTGGSSGSASTTTTAAGPPFSATGFTTVVPNGWTNGTTADNTGNTGTKFLASFDNNSVGTIEVAQVGTGQVDTASVVTQVAQKLGGTSISAPQTFSVAGASGNYVTFGKKASDGTQLQAEVGVVIHNSTGYQIQYIAASNQFDSNMSAFQTVISNWKWTS